MEVRPSYNPDSNTFYLEISSNLLENYFNNLRGMLISNQDFKNIEVTKKNCDTALITFTVKKEDLPETGKGIDKSSKLSDLLKDSSLPEELKSMLNQLSESGLSEDVNVMAISMSDKANPISRMNDLLNDFINSAVRDKFKTTEFIPLINYPHKNLKEDIITAIKAKRNICIVDDFENYKKSTEDKSLEFNQYFIKYSTSEYADVAILISLGKFKELIDTFSPKLKQIAWI